MDPSMRDAYFFSKFFCDVPATMKQKNLDKGKVAKNIFFILGSSFNI